MAGRAPREPRAAGAPGSVARPSRTPRVAPPLAAYVLHRYEWSESSLVLDLFTREQGRIAAVARGARKPYSQLRGVLLPFQALQVGVGRAATVRDGDDDTPPEVQLLRSAEWTGGRPMPTGAALWSGFYLNELLLRLLARHDPHPRLFDAYAASVAALASLPGADDDGQAVLRGFELVLLGETGHLADLAVETASQAPLDPARRYRVLADAGVVEEGNLGHAAGLASGATLLALQQALAARDIAALWRVAAARPAEVRPWLRHLLAYHLGGDDALRTRRVLRDAQSLDAAARRPGSGANRSS